jgi:hypothetical protein
LEDFENDNIKICIDLASPDRIIYQIQNGMKLNNVSEFYLELIKLKIKFIKKKQTT